MDIKKYFNSQDILRGALVYSIGDSLAAIILSQFTLIRFIGMLLVGGLIYSVEVPNYFKWIDKKIEHSASKRSQLYRSLLAMMFFNPVWIARHMIFIDIFLGKFSAIGWHLLIASSYSFLGNIPVSLTANYIIQNKIPFKWRFISSAIFSGLMALYYALSKVWFS